MNIEELIASLPDKERSNINELKFTLRIPDVLYAKGGHLFDGKNEDTLLLNDATYVAPIRVPNLGEIKKVTGGYPLGTLGQWLGLALEGTPEYIPFSLLLQGLGLYLQTDLPTEEEQKLILLKQREEILQRSKENPYEGVLTAGLLGLSDGINIGILNEAIIPTPTYTTSIKAEFSPYATSIKDNIKALESNTYCLYMAGLQELFPGQFKLLDKKLLGHPAYLNEKSKQILELNIKRLAAMRPYITEEKLRTIVQKEANKPYKIYPRETFIKAGIDENIEGLHFDRTGNIAIVEDSSMNPIIIETHETRHSLQDILPRTEAENNILKSAYSDLDTALKESNYMNTYSRANNEWETLNNDARLLALGYEKSAHFNMNQLNAVIDRLSDKDIIESMRYADGYGKNLVEYYERKGEVPKEKIDAWREAMKYVGMSTTGISAISSPFISTKEDNNKANGGTLHKYSKGTEHDLSNEEVFDLIKKGYKISYL